MSKDSDRKEYLNLIPYIDKIINNLYMHYCARIFNLNSVFTLSVATTAI